MLIYASVAGAFPFTQRGMTACALVTTCALRHFFHQFFLASGRKWECCPTAMGAGVFYMATRDVRQGSKLVQQGAQQFRANMKTMKGWAEEEAERCASTTFSYRS